MLASVDKSLHGAETGELSKLEVREALDAFFMVGQPGGKTLNRFDEIMQASIQIDPQLMSPASLEQDLHVHASAYQSPHESKKHEQPDGFIMLGWPLVHDDITLMRTFSRLFRICWRLIVSGFNNFARSRMPS